MTDAESLLKGHLWLTNVRGLSSLRGETVREVSLGRVISVIDATQGARRLRDKSMINAIDAIQEIREILVTQGTRETSVVAQGTREIRETSVISVREVRMISVINATTEANAASQDSSPDSREGT